MINDLENNLDPFGIVPKYEYIKYDSIGFEISECTSLINQISNKFKLLKFKFYRFYYRITNNKTHKIHKWKF